MSESVNLLKVLPGNPILVRALERELREAEKRIEHALNWDISRLAEGIITGADPGKGPHIERSRKARGLLMDAENNYHAVLAELDRARAGEAWTVRINPGESGVLSGAPCIVGGNTVRASDVHGSRSFGPEKAPVPATPKKRKSSSHRRAST